MKYLIVVITLIFFVSASSALSHADSLNTETGEYIRDMGDGDSLGTETGQYYLDMGDGDQINTETGAYIMDMD